MKTKNQKLIEEIKRRGGIFNFSDILKVGYHRDQIAQLKKNNTIEKISKGYYKLTDFIPSQYLDFIYTATINPKGIVCLLSALNYYGVTDEIPRVVDLAIPRGAHPKKIEFPPVQYFNFSKDSWKEGIKEVSVDGLSFRIYSLEKTLADCFKFRNQIGIDVARSALKEALFKKKSNPREILHYAKICRVENIIIPFIETLLT